jgi:hypothetical protein
MERTDRYSPEDTAGSGRNLERLARAGYLTKGIVYALVGVLAAQAALGAGGATTDTEGALQRIVTEPFGRVLLGLVTFAQAVLDPENKGDDAGGLAKRAGSLVSGIAYGGLALTAGRLALGTGGGGGGSSGPEDLSARLMGWPLGVWLVGLIGLLVIGFGLQQLYKGYQALFRDKLKHGEMSASELIWTVRAGRLGLAARGIVFGIIGMFLVRAALSANPEQARGLGEALATLARQPLGPLLLGTVALGLVAYGIYMVLLARYRRFPA